LRVAAGGAARVQPAGDSGERDRFHWLSHGRIHGSTWCWRRFARMPRTADPHKHLCLMMSCTYGGQLERVGRTST
jgi:hypothetical protein